jgi:putative peptide zinc metalloprotease protein
VDGQTRVQFYPLLKRREGDEVMVGRSEINSFIFLPPEGIALIEFLEQGMTLEETQTAYNERYGEVPDVADLVEGLNSVGFVARILEPGAEVPVVESAPAAPAPAGHFASITQRTAARFFSPPLLVLYGAYIVGAFAVMLVFRPSLIPNGADQYFLKVSLVVSILSLTVWGWMHMFLHEMAHLLAARSVGVPARLTLGRRLMTPVALTDMAGIYTVAPEQRYLPYLAGMLFDLLMLSTFVYLLALSDWGILLLPAALYGLSKAIIARISMALTWQFRLPLRTDIYFVVTNWLRARNLQMDTLGFLANLRDQLRRRAPRYDLSGLPKRELWMVRVYAPILLAGFGLYWFFFLYFTIPFLYKTFPVAFRNVMAGLSNPVAFADGLVFLILMGVEWGWLLYVTVRDWRTQRAQRQRAGGEADAAQASA